MSRSTQYRSKKNNRWKRKIT